MTQEHYEEDWGRHNETPHPFFDTPGSKTDDPLPRYLQQFVRTLDDEQLQDAKDLLCIALRRLLTLICSAETRAKKRASAIAARAVLLHRAICHPDMNTRDIAEAYGVPGNAVYDELKALDSELSGLARILH